MSFCEVSICRSTQDPTRVYHKFPIDDPIRCKKWLKIVGKKKSDLKVRSSVCSKHFRVKDYCPGGKRLHPTAIPLLRLTEAPKNEKKSGPVERNTFDVKQISINKTSQRLCGKNNNSPLKSKYRITVKTEHYPSSLKQKNETQLNRNLDKNFEMGKMNNSVDATAIDTFNPPFNNINKKNKNIALENSKLGERYLKTSALGLRKKTLTKKRKRLLSEKSSSDEEVLPTSLNKSKKVVTSFKNGLGGIATTKTHSIPINKNMQEQENKENADMQNKDYNVEKQLKMHEVAIKNLTNALMYPRNPHLQTFIDEKLDNLNLNNDHERTCRLCFQLVDKKEDLCPLFWPGKNETLLSWIKDATGVEVRLQDGVPTGICVECLKDIGRFNWLKGRVQQCDIKINQKFPKQKMASSDQNNEEMSQETCDVIPNLYESSNEEEQAHELKIEDVFSLKDITTFEDVQVMPDLEPDIQTNLDVVERDIEDDEYVQNMPDLEPDIQTKLGVVQPITTFEGIQTMPDLEPDIQTKPDVVELDIKNDEDVHTKPDLEPDIQTKLDAVESDIEDNLLNEVEKTFIITTNQMKTFKKCKICGNIFANSKTLMIHLKYCTKRFQCFECKKCFMSSELFRKHKQRLISCFGTKNLRYCSLCDISFRWKWQLVFHVLRHYTQECGLCCEELYSREHFQRHLKQAHF